MFYTLYYTLEEMNNDVNEVVVDGKFQKETYYEIVKADINEESKIGNAVIRNVKTSELDYWHWDEYLQMWIKEGDDYIVDVKVKEE